MSRRAGGTRLALALAFALPAAAWAQPAEPPGDFAPAPFPAPPPPPQLEPEPLPAPPAPQPLPVAPEPIPLASGARPTAPPRSLPPSAEYAPPISIANFGPTVGLGAGGGGDFASINGWLGLSFHPLPGSVSPWVALGTELNGLFPARGGRGTFEVVPELRAGFSVPMDDEHAYVARLFPIIQLYTLVGVRLPNPARDAAVRVGAGVSVVGFAWVQLSLYPYAPPVIPWCLEATYDVAEPGVFALRVLYHF